MMFTFLIFCSVILIVVDVAIKKSRLNKRAGAQRAHALVDDPTFIDSFDAMGSSSIGNDALHETLSDADER